MSFQSWRASSSIFNAYCVRRLFGLLAGKLCAFLAAVGHSGLQWLRIPSLIHSTKVNGRSVWFVFPCCLLSFFFSHRIPSHLTTLEQSRIAQAVHARSHRESPVEWLNRCSMRKVSIVGRSKCGSPPFFSVMFALPLLLVVLSGINYNYFPPSISWDGSVCAICLVRQRYLHGWLIHFIEVLRPCRKPNWYAS